MIPTSKNVRTISDMRENAQKLLREAQALEGPLYILYRSKPRAVLLSLDEYEKLADFAEDYLDSLKAAEFEKEDKHKIKWLSHDTFKASLR